MNRPWLNLLATLVPALLLLAWSVYFMLRARRSARWPQVPATILESRVQKQGNSRSPRVRFEYHVAQRRHVGDRVWLGPTSVSVTGDWANRVAARYPVGAAVRVAVDPADPGYAVLEPGLRLAHWLPLAIGVVIMIGGVVSVAATA